MALGGILQANSSGGEILNQFDSRGQRPLRATGLQKPVVAARTIASQRQLLVVRGMRRWRLSAKNIQFDPLRKCLSLNSDFEDLSPILCGISEVSFLDTDEDSPPHAMVIQPSQ